MNVEPMINVRLKKFREMFDLTNVPDGEAFERFVNHTILTAHQPDAFSSADRELFDFVCVGGSNDMGIDGISIKLNGLFVKSISDVKDIISRSKRATVEFIFIQSKYKDKFDKGEFNNFVAGVRDFLSQKQLQPINDKICDVLKLKDYLLSDDIVLIWDDNPSVRLYYVAMGKWRDSPHQLALAEQFKNDVTDFNTYGNTDVHFVDSESLKNICDNNESTFSSVLSAIDTMSLTSVEGVDDSCMVLCYANEYAKLLNTDDRIIRKSLFDDNVRDYQGNNNINEEIFDTLANDPTKFALLNNGITIVCDEYIHNNRKITLKNPQIVNGCQTSHVLYYSEQSNDISLVPLVIKVIATKDLNIVNQIVRGTNRQNIVYDEAFETTKKFHKDLEEFFMSYSPEDNKIYYERRSKQYMNNPTIKPSQKYNLKIILQSFIGMYLSKPHLSHRHETFLLKEYGGKIFQEDQSRLPYFVSTYSYYAIEMLVKKSELILGDFFNYRNHILMIFRELVAGPCPPIDNTPAIDEYSAKIFDILKDKKKSIPKFKESLSVLTAARDEWTGVLKRSQYGMKDIEDFTNLILGKIPVTTTRSAFESYDSSRTYRGKVMRVINDKFGKLCGFISRQPDNIFFHSSHNKSLNLANAHDKYVSYKIEQNIKTGKPFAVEVQLIGN